MAVYLKAYDKTGKLLATGHEITEEQGSVIIASLTPHTVYPEGSFYISWQGNNFETEKIAVPEFETHESTHREFVFYFNDHVTVNGKSAYQVAVDAGFTGTVEEWLETIKGDPLRFEDLTPEQKAELKGAKGDGLKFDGIVLQPSELPEGTTKSTYLVGSIIYSRAEGSSTWVKGADLKSTLTIQNGYIYIDGVKTNTPFDETTLTKNIKEYFTDKGANLVGNGFGYLDKSNNFSTFEVDPLDTPVGKASYKVSSPYADRTTDGYIPVDVNKTYEFSAYAKSKNSTATQFIGLQCVDIDKIYIQPQHVKHDNTAVVTLTRQLNPGDTKIYLSDVTPFLDTTAPWSLYPASTRAVALWKYKDSRGYEYPIKTYTQYAQRGISSVDANEKSITLTAGWGIKNKETTDGSFPIGHPVTRSAAGANFNYILTQTKVPITWTKYTNTISGVLQGDINDFKFRVGTAYVRPVFLANYTAGTTDEVWYAGIELKELDSRLVTLMTHNHDSAYSKLGHTHFTTEVLTPQGTNLDSVLKNKADLTHDHDTTYSKLGHKHTIAEVTGLDTALNNKSNTGHSHKVADISDLTVFMEKYALLDHRHDDLYVQIANAFTRSKADALYMQKGEGLTRADADNLYAPYGSTGAQLELADYIKMVDGDVRYASKTHYHKMSDITDLIGTIANLAPLAHNHDGIYAKKGEVLTKAQADMIYAKIGSVIGDGNTVIEKSPMQKDIADFGFIGDGITNNYNAYKAWRDHAQAYPGTTYWVNPIYIDSQGQVKRAQYRSAEFKTIKNIDGNVVDGTPDDIIWTLQDITINANGALFISSPTDGFVKTPTFENSSGWYTKEEHLTLFNFEDCKNLTVNNLEVTGESEKIRWAPGVTIAEGKNARFNSNGIIKQVAEGRGHGIVIAGGKHIIFNHVRANKFSVDGLAIGFKRDTPNYKLINAEFLILNNCEFNYNGRLGASGLGVHGALDINSVYNHNGTTFFNAPAMGFDLEPHGSPIGADNLWLKSLAPAGTPTDKTTNWSGNKWNGNFTKIGGEIIGNRGGALAVSSTMLTRNVTISKTTIKASKSFPAPHYLITASAQDVKFIDCDVDGLLANKDMAVIFPFGYGDLLSQPTGVLLSDFAGVKTSFEGGQYSAVDFWTNDDDNGTAVRNDIKPGEWGMHELYFKGISFTNARFRYNHSRKTVIDNCQFVFTDEHNIGYFNLWNSVVRDVTMISKKASGIFLGFGSGDNSSQIYNLQVTKDRFTFKEDAPYLTKQNKKENIDIYDRNSMFDYLLNRIGGSGGTGTDTTPPNAPFVNSILNTSTTVTGMAEPNSTVIATFPGGITAQAVANSNYLFSINVPQGVTLVAGNNISIVAKDLAMNTSPVTVVAVSQDTPTDTGTTVQTPTISAFKVGDSYLTGTAEANSTITVTFNGNNTQTTTSTSSGYWQINVTNLGLTAGTTISVTAKNKAGVSSSVVTATVQAPTGDTTPPSAPQVNTVYTNSTTITGTAEANSTVIATFNSTGTTAQAIASNTGAYTITKSSTLTLSAGHTIDVVARDAAGNTSSPTRATVQSVASTSLYPATNKTSGVITATDGIYQLNNILALSWNNDPITLSASNNVITLTDNKPAHTIYALWTMPKANTRYTVTYSVTNSKDLLSNPISSLGVGAIFAGGTKSFSFTTDANKKFGFNFLWGSFGNADSSSTGLFHVTNGVVGSTTTYTITEVKEG